MLHPVYFRNSYFVNAGSETVLLTDDNICSIIICIFYVIISRKKR